MVPEITNRITFLGIISNKKIEMFSKNGREERGAMVIVIHSFVVSTFVLAPRTHHFCRNVD